MVRATGVEPLGATGQGNTANETHHGHTEDNPSGAVITEGHFETKLSHAKDVSDAAPCCADVATLPNDLQSIIAAWSTLPDAVKAGIVATVTALTGK